MIEWFMVFFILTQGPEEALPVAHSLEMLYPGFATVLECESAGATRLVELTRDAPLVQMSGRHERRFVCTSGIPPRP